MTKFALLSLAFVALPVTATAQSEPSLGPSGYLDLTVGYSERNKETIGARLAFQNLLGKPIDVSVGGEKNNLGYQWNADISLKTKSWPSSVENDGFVLGYQGYAYSWEDSAFDTDRQGIYIANSFRAGPNTDLSFRFDLYEDSISNVSPTTSPLIGAETGTVPSGGLSVGFRYDTRSGGFFPNRGVLFGANAQYFGLVGDAKWYGLSASAEGYFPVSDRFYVSSRANIGMAKGYDGYDLRITERAFIGYLQPRGFAYGGLGPADVNTDDIVTSLGGEKFATASLALNYKAFSNENSTYVLSLFTDVGSVWELSETTGGFLAEIDDDYYLRQSFGIGLSLRTQFGVFELNFAEPSRKRDLDQVQEFSFTFKTSF